MIQQTVFGLGIFTKEASARFRYRGPPGSDVPGSDNYSMISDSFARNTLREACSAVHDSLELDEAVDRAVANPDEGFDYSAQHKLCLELDYCHVRNRASGARRRRTARRRVTPRARSLVTSCPPPTTTRRARARSSASVASPRISRRRARPLATSRASRARPRSSFSAASSSTCSRPRARRTRSREARPRRASRASTSVASA